MTLPAVSLTLPFTSSRLPLISSFVLGFICFLLRIVESLFESCLERDLGPPTPTDKLTVLGVLTFPKASRGNASTPSRHHRAKIAPTERSIGLTCCTSL